MLLFDLGIVEIQGIATVVVFAFSFYLLTELRALRSEVRKIKPSEKTDMTPLILQAYERLTLLTDRISLKNLVNRLHGNVFGAGELHGLLLETIRSEYEHNITQQNYVNAEIWKAVTNLKEQNVYIINQLTGNLPPNATAHDLSRSILQYAANENAELGSIVLDAIQYEVKKLA